MTTLTQGLSEAPRSVLIVPSADYKSVDPDVQEVIPACDSVGLKVELDITAASGGGGVTVKIDARDEGSNTWVNLLTSALKTATGHTTLRVDPRIAASANLIAQDGLAGSVRVVCTGSGTRTTLTYSVGVSFHK